MKANNVDSSEDLDAGNSFDSTNVSSNTPRSKNLLSVTAKPEVEVEKI